MVDRMRAAQVALHGLKNSVCTNGPILRIRSNRLEAEFLDFAQQVPMAG